MRFEILTVEKGKNIVGCDVIQCCIVIPTYHIYLLTPTPHIVEQWHFFILKIVSREFFQNVHTSIPD
jgi:hypothetical protein